MLATIIGLLGKKVDIVTSNKILAIRDSELRRNPSRSGYQNFYQIFGLSANNNCDEHCDIEATGEAERRNRYKNNQIMYGETSFFQRDLLLTKFFSKQILENPASVLILDEVDSMMIDNLVKLLYISHKISDFRYLKDIFIEIWKTVNSLKEQIYSEENVRNIIKYIYTITKNKYDVFIDSNKIQKALDELFNKKNTGLTDKAKSDLKDFLINGKPVEVCSKVFIKLENQKYVCREDIIDSLKIILFQKINEDSQGKTNDDQIKRTEYIYSQLLFKDNERLCDKPPIEIQIPKNLNEFLKSNLKTWIDNAYYAKILKENDSYIIGDEKSNKPDEIIIMNKDTGVEELSSRWSKGLHQFLQLKHSKALTEESLKAVFISNMKFFNDYNHVYGLTGTVGGYEERRLVRNIYNIDSFELPRFKMYRYTYDVDSESISSSKSQWIQNILIYVEDNMFSQSYYNDEERKTIRTSSENYQLKLNDSEKEIKTIQMQIQSFKQKILKLNEDKKSCEEIILSKDKLLNIRDQKIHFEEKKKEVILIKRYWVKQNNKFASLFIEKLKKIDSIQYDYEFENFFIEIQDCILPIACNINKFKQMIEEEEAKSLILVNEEKHKSIIIQTLNKDIITCKKELKKRNRNIKDFKDCRKAILFICENVLTVQLLHEILIKQFKNHDKIKIYRYDSSFSKFEKSRLEQGDIIIATNIAGRGTDLEISELVENNGGLLVVFTYYANNERVQLQGFGRTARAGKKGKGTYIIFDAKGRSMLELKKERDEREIKRLNNIKTKSCEKVKLEDSLFEKFSNFKEELEKKFIHTNLFKSSFDRY